MELPSNTLLQNGKYKIIKKIGQGGFGIAYKAYAEHLKKDVCVKEFFFSDLCERAKDSSNVTIISSYVDKINRVNSFKKKFIKEAQRLAQFQHPNIVQVTDVFEENNTAYYVMEYLDGGSLDDLIKQNGALSEQRAKELILPIIDALEIVHKANLLHLDINPRNIMLRRNQSPVLIDFGISKYLEDGSGNQNTKTTASIGYSEGYSPIEQSSFGSSIADFTKATDIYSLCATIYKIVTGVTPPTHNQIITNGLKSPKELNSCLSTGINAAIVKGMSIKAIDRPQTCLQLRKMFGESKTESITVSQTVIAPLEPVLTTAAEFFKRAEKRRKNKEYKVAIEDYSEAIKKKEKNENYYFFKGICYHELENYNAAIKDYSKVIEMNPNWHTSYYNRGLCYSQIGKYEAASMDSFKAFELEQKDMYFIQWMKMAEKSQDLVTVNKYLSNENWLNKDKVYLTRGGIYLKKGDVIKTCDDFYQAYILSKKLEYLEYWIKTNNIEILANYLERDLPNKDKVYFTRGEIYLKKGDVIKACDDFYQAYILSKKLEYLEYWIKTNNIEILANYLERDLPNKDKVYFARGIILYDRREKVAGKADVKLAKELGSSDAKEWLKCNSLWRKMYGYPTDIFDWLPILLIVLLFLIGLIRSLLRNF